VVLFDRKRNTTKIRISAIQRISNMNCFNYDNNIFGLFQFQSGYRKYYFNSPNGLSRKIINAQTGARLSKVVSVLIVNV